VTAIAGVVRPRNPSFRETQVSEFLNEQRDYGSSRRHFAQIGRATFGISPRGTTASPPASSEQLILVADLRLDNRSELMERVGRSLHRSTDTELLLAAWVKAGEESLSWIAGDFAVAIFDSRSQVLSLATDSTGQMPLHYAKVLEGCAFASMPSGLRPFLGALAINRHAVAATVCDLRDDDPQSHFENVSRVLPGEIVRLGTSGISRKIYWVPRTVYDEPLKSADLVEEYRQLLDVAVADRLKGCALPVATHLSSGYDSSAVTATAARLLQPDQIVAFTSAPASHASVPAALWRISDESEIAARTAASLGVRHVIVREMPSVRNVLRRQSLLFQEPLIGVANIPWLLQIRREAASFGATCLLSGDYGNASLNAGGLYVLSEWVRQSRWVTWIRQARLAAARHDTHWRGVLFNSLNPWIPTLVSEKLRKYYFGAGPADEVSFLRPHWREAALGRAHRPPRPVNGYQERIHLIRNGHTGMIRKGGLAGEGVDERDPFADRRLIEFSLNIPPQELYWNGVPRPLARRALSDRVPKWVIDSKFRGLQGADWATRFTRANAREMLEEISVSSAAADLFDLGRMRHAIEHWPTENWNERSMHRLYRQSLLLALAGGMFALVHETGASANAEKL
jgi:asparagine synthase (glutamine-hydrolysing)